MKYPAMDKLKKVTTHLISKATTEKEKKVIKMVMS